MSIPAVFLALILPALAATEDAPSFPAFSVQATGEYLHKLSKNIPETAPLLFLQARLQSNLGRQDQAVLLARQSLQLDPAQPHIHAFLADLFIREDRLEEALAELRQSLALNPALEGASCRLGMVQDRLGDRTVARKSFAAALALDPNDSQAHLLLGRLLLDLDSVAEAIPHLARACELAPQTSNPFYVLARAQTRLGRHEAARETLRKFEQLKAKEKEWLDQKNAARDGEEQLRRILSGFHCEIALALPTGQTGLIQAHLDQATRIAPNDPLPLETLVSHHLRGGRFADARKACQRLVELEPGNATYHLKLGSILLELREQAEGVAHLKRTLELDPNRPEALHNLARFHLGARRELPQALAWARQLVELQPTAPNYDLLAWAAFSNGQVDAARAAAAQSVKLDPGNLVYQERSRRLEAIP